MVIIQDENKDVVAVKTVLTKALDAAGIPRTKYEYIRSRLVGKTTIRWKGFYITRK